MLNEMVAMLFIQQDHDVDLSVCIECNYVSRLPHGWIRAFGDDRTANFGLFRRPTLNALAPQASLWEGLVSMRNYEARILGRPSAERDPAETCLPTAGFTKNTRMLSQERVYEVRDINTCHTVAGFLPNSYR